MNNQEIANSIQTTLNVLKPQVEALEAALIILKDGFQTDQARIDADIAKDKESRSAEIESLKAQVIDKDNLQVKVDSLTKASQKANETLATVVTTISNALAIALPAGSSPTGELPT